MKKIVSLLASAVLVAGMCCIGGCSNNSSKTDQGKEGYYSKTTVIGHSTWIGYAPLYIAEEKGFFKDHGADVENKVIEGGADKRAALAADEIQVMATTVDTHLISDASGVDVVQFLGMDTSCGGDGVVAKKEIQTIQDLKGKKVALDTTSGADYFWFQTILADNGMTLDDINVQAMSSSGDAGAAFISGDVDAGVTWQPWLNNAKDTEFGHVLTDSSKSPGIIVDSLACTREFEEKNPKTVEAIVSGWYDAIDYIKTNPDDAYKIMSKSMGMNVEDFKESLKDLEYYDKEKNKSYFGEGDQKGQIYDIAQKAQDLWLKNGTIKEKIDLNSVITNKFIEGSK